VPSMAATMAAAAPVRIRRFTISTPA
jgi:hypothetical protein